MENQNPIITPPARTLAVMYASRLGKILFNISIICSLLALGSFMSVFATIFYILFGLIFIIIASVVSFGIIYLAWPTLWADFANGLEMISDFSNNLFSALPVIIPIALIASVLSIIFLCIDKHNKSVARIVISSILIVVYLIVLAVILLGAVQA